MTGRHRSEGTGPLVTAHILTRRHNLEVFRRQRPGPYVCDAWRPVNAHVRPDGPSWHLPAGTVFWSNSIATPGFIRQLGKRHAQR